MGPDKGANYVALANYVSFASMAAVLQLENDPIDFRQIKFFAFEHWIYSHVCGKLDYYIINVHFTVISDCLRATNYSDSFLSWAQSKSFKLASHVAYCVPVLSSKIENDWNKSLCF